MTERVGSNNEKCCLLIIEEFSVDRGKQKIEEYISTWNISKKWLNFVSFLQEKVGEYSTVYRYKVQWSMPTRKRPIPRATASVYFNVEVSSVKPKHFPVKVSFTFETCKLVHRPGETVVSEKWLHDIVESKVLLIDNVTF